MTTYSRFCYQMLSDYVKLIRRYFLDLKSDLQAAGMNFTLDEYLSMTLFTSLMVFVVENIIMAFIFGILTKDVISSLILGFTFSSAFAGVIFFLFYTYPSVLKGKKADEIDRLLPFAVSYMASIAAGNPQPVYLFKTISEFGEYGEVSKEAKDIVRNVEMFGMNFSDAVKREALRTPSRTFKEVLWGLLTAIESGASIESFLSQKANELMADYRRRVKRYSQLLSMLIQIYLTLIITGSIFFIVLTSIMASTAGFSIVAIQSFIVFIFLPFISIIFLILIKTKSPTGG